MLYRKCTIVRANLTIRSVATGSDDFARICPVSNLTVDYVPYSNFGIERTTEEIIVIDWIELHASYCNKHKIDPLDRLWRKKIK